MALTFEKGLREYRQDRAKREFSDSQYVDEEGEYMLDSNGYYRFSRSGRLVHRDVAYRAHFLPNRSTFPLSFKDYVVHHKDGNKLNNKPSNLEILTWGEHSNLHSQKASKEALMIFVYICIGVFLLFAFPVALVILLVVLFFKYGFRRRGMKR